MIGFLGEYEVTLDGRGRFLVPAAFKKQLTGDNANQFVISRGIESCLTLYPIQTWEPVFADISKLNDFDPQVREFRRKFLNGATQIELDSVGRLLLPKPLIEYAGLDKDVLLVSAVNKIEIWDSSKYKKLFEPSSPDELSKLANIVMNKGNIVKND
ncbi:MAG: division/cell wall cluster transcriptional repressor MraZ [Chitinophagaceae bacterium]|nr:division/cell wall cluster transcriptional repressor MraZ [Chitinophagaceae bacterium]